MKKMAMQYGISIRLIFTEAGHGKSPCDGVGGNIKTQVEAAMLKKVGDTEISAIHSAEGILNLIKEETNLTYDITVHKTEQYRQIDENLPKLGPLVGALKLHEVMITSDGVIKKKNLPTDYSYQSVTIRESRKRNQTIEVLNNDINEAFIAEEDESITGTNHVENINILSEMRLRTRGRRIMTADEIQAELDENSEQYSSESDHDD